MGKKIFKVSTLHLKEAPQYFSIKYLKNAILIAKTYKSYVLHHQIS